MNRDTGNAWTAGPWNVIDVQFGGPRVVDANGSFIADAGEPIYQRTKPNAQLIALAPEMADAILAWCKEWAPVDYHEGEETGLALFALAAKLRAINEATSNETSGT